MGTAVLGVFIAHNVCFFFSPGHDVKLHLVARLKFGSSRV